MYTFVIKTRTQKYVYRFIETDPMYMALTYYHRYCVAIWLGNLDCNLAIAS